jgi:HK97 family phage major capsid protein
MNVQGGVEIPLLDVLPTASWITEAKVSADQALDATKTISFKYYGLECRIAQTLLASVVTFAEFQAQFVPLAVEAMLEKIEQGIFNGTGSGQMLGVCNDSRVTNVVTLTETDVAKWSAWKKKFFAAIKLAYNRGNIYMAKGTFDGYIDGMVDTNGQPIARVNYGIDGAEGQRFGGKNVVLVNDDVLTPWDQASAGDVVAVYLNPTDYAINTNMQMQVVQWTDHDTNTVKTKVQMVLDGKIVDANGVILVKKGGASA